MGFRCLFPKRYQTILLYHKSWLNSLLWSSTRTLSTIGHFDFPVFLLSFLIPTNIQNLMRLKFLYPYSHITFYSVNDNKCFSPALMWFSFLDWFYFHLNMIFFIFTSLPMQHSITIGTHPLQSISVAMSGWKVKCFVKQSKFYTLLGHLRPYRHPGLLKFWCLFVSKKIASQCLDITELDCTHCSGYRPEQRV